MILFSQDRVTREEGEVFPEYRNTLPRVASIPGLASGRFSWSVNPR